MSKTRGEGRGRERATAEERRVWNGEMLLRVGVRRWRVGRQTDVRVDMA